MDKREIFNKVLFVSLFLLCLITLIDLALVGQHQQFYKWLLTND
jgi:protein-S-isoprenylcysteine O-methyltransferase Ste14